jgi:hypothetical protein
MRRRRRHDHHPTARAAEPLPGGMAGGFVLPVALRTGGEEVHGGLEDHPDGDVADEKDDDDIGAVFGRLNLNQVTGRDSIVAFSITTGCFGLWKATPLS